MLAVMSPLPNEGLGGRTWSQDGLVGLELESEPTEASAPVAAPLWEACMPTPEQEGSPPRSRARSVRFAHASLSLRIRVAHDGARADT